MSGASLTCPLEVIGVVRTGRASLEHTPIQAALNRNENGIIDILEPFAEGLSGLAGFDYAWLLTWLDRPDSAGDAVLLTQIPFLLRPEQRRVGIFAMRGPRRVNPIGLSLIQVLEVAGAQVRFAGVDLLDGTPVIDLKPYVTRFDRPAGEPRCGWYDTVPIRDGVMPVDLEAPTMDTPG